METKQVIVVRRDLNMGKGKIAAQVAHASMAFLTRNYQHRESYNGITSILTCMLREVESRWLSGSFSKIVVSVDSEKELLDLMIRAEEEGISVYEIIDSGKTEFHGKATLTCAAFGPDLSEKLDTITGNLKLM